MERVRVGGAFRFEVAPTAAQRGGMGTTARSFGRGEEIWIEEAGRVYTQEYATGAWVVRGLRKHTTFVL